MKKYIEALEITETDEKEFIQEEIESNYKEDKIEIAKDKLKLKEKEGKTYKYRIHICLHEEGLPCVVEYLY